MGKRTWSAEEENELRILYNEGYLSREIAEILNNKFHNGENRRNKVQVRQKASRLGGLVSKFYSKEVNGLYYCSHCKSYKEKHYFRSNRTSKNGIGNLCRPCESTYRRKLRFKNKLETSVDEKGNLIMYVYVLKFKEDCENRYNGLDDIKVECYIGLDKAQLMLKRRYEALKQWLISEGEKEEELHENYISENEFSISNGRDYFSCQINKVNVL